MTSNIIPQGRSGHGDAPAVPTFIGSVTEEHRASLEAEGYAVYTWAEFWARANRPPTPFDEFPRDLAPHLPDTVVWDSNEEGEVAA